QGSTVTSCLRSHQNTTDASPRGSSPKKQTVSLRFCRPLFPRAIASLLTQEGHRYVHHGVPWPSSLNSPARRLPPALDGQVAPTSQLPCSPPSPCSTCAS